MTQDEIISKVKFKLLEKYTAINLLPSELIINDCIDKTLEVINYTHSCKSDSEQLVCDDNELDCPFDFTSRCTMGKCGCKPKAN